MYADAERKRFYTTSVLGPRRAKTPEGFLVTYDVPIARTGEQIYAPQEVEDFPPDADGRIHVLREPDEVFRPETVASFEGKPTTNDHPPVDVTTDNYKQYLCGHVSNVRRGSGEFDQHLLADLVWMCPQAIGDIESGKKDEISCGYDCDWVVDDDRPGWGWQTNIIGNHVALVDYARCGGSCSIRDAHKPQETASMASQRRSGGRGSFMDRRFVLNLLRRARSVGANDDAALEQLASEHEQEGDRIDALDDAEMTNKPGEETHVHVHTDPNSSGDPGAGLDAEGFVPREEFEDRMKAHDDGLAKCMDGIRRIHDHLGISHHDDAEGELKELSGEFEEEAPEYTGDRRGAKDSGMLETAYQDTLAGCELLAPGFSPRRTFARDSRPRQTFDGLCQMRKDALAIAASGPMAAAIHELNGRKPFDGAKLSCRDSRTLFRAAVALKRSQNNGARDSAHARATDAAARELVQAGPQSLADINKQNREFYYGKESAQ